MRPARRPAVRHWITFHVYGNYRNRSSGANRGADSSRTARLDDVHFEANEFSGIAMELFFASTGPPLNIEKVTSWLVPKPPENFLYQNPIVLDGRRRTEN